MEYTYWEEYSQIQEVWPPRIEQYIQKSSLPISRKERDKGSTKEQSGTHYLQGHIDSSKANVILQRGLLSFHLNGDI